MSYSAFFKVLEHFRNVTMYGTDEVFQKLIQLEEEGIRAKEALYLFSKEMEDEVDKQIIVEERKKIKELYIEKVIEEEKVWRKRTIAVLDLYWSDDAQYVQVRVRPQFSHWVVSTYEEDTGAIQWIETEEGVLYKTDGGWEVFSSAEVLDSGTDWTHHDGATYPRVRFTKKSGEIVVYRV